MTFSVAHLRGMNPIGENLWPDGRVPWEDAIAPDLEHGRFAGQLRACPYCGSMHPSDVYDALKHGAKGSWADWKYGWPHKAYFTGVPNPHAGLLESRSGSSSPVEGWVQVNEHYWRDPGKPASATTTGKFYSVHLKDATFEEKALIEEHLGITFDFTDDGQLSWRPLK